MAVDRLFTHGSLQPGGPNQQILAALEGEWQEASVTGRLVEEDWGAEIGYPALALEEMGDPVAGWVFTSAELGEHWSRLDDFEGQGYRRVAAHVTLSDGEVVAAHVYVLR